VLLLVPVALATPATSTCAPAEVVAFFPSEGAEVPPDVHPLAAQEGECGGFSWVLRSDAGAEIWPAIEVVSDGLLRLVPAEPLAEGRWTATAYDSGFVGTFTVAADAPWPPPSPTDPVVTEVTADPECRSGAALTVGAVVELTPGGVGLLTLGWRTENGEQLRTTHLVGDRSLVVDEVTVLGRREACVAATLTDLEGAVVGVDEACVDEALPPCRTGARDRAGVEEGCGCDGTGGAGPLAAALLVLARRVRAPARTARR
jgi:hypothetical protein